jgi:hypothetical protein
MDSINPLIVLCLLVPVFYISGFAHELGHAVMGRAVGFVVTSFGLGTGQPLAVLTWRGSRVFFCRKSPFQGLTFCFIPRMAPSRTHVVPFMAGGIIANALLCTAAIGLWRFIPWGRDVWFTAASLNGVIAISNLVPYRFRVGKATIRSDGNMILRGLFRRANPLPPPMIIMSVQALRGLWESIGDYLILRANLLGSASAWVALGDIERAEMVYREVESLPAVDVPSFLAREAYIRSMIARGAGHNEEATSALDAAQAYFRSGGDEMGLLCVAIQRALARTQSGDVRAAVIELENMVSHPVVRSNRVLRDDLWLARFTAYVALSDVAAVEEMISHDKVVGRKRFSATRELAVYQTLARLYAQKKDWASAEPAYRRAITAVYAIANAWPDAEERHRFLARQSAFFDEARHCFQVLNKSGEADRIIRPVVSVEEIKQQLDEAPRLRHRRLLRAGLWLLLADVLSIPCAIVLWALMPVQEWGSSLVVALSLLVLYTVCALLYLLFHAAIGRFIPGLRYSGGAVILVLASMPWLSLVFIPLFWLLQLSP